MKKTKSDGLLKGVFLPPPPDPLNERINSLEIRISKLEKNKEYKVRGTDGSKRREEKSYPATGSAGTGCN